MKSIFLVGYMGCGKSTLGRKLRGGSERPLSIRMPRSRSWNGASVADVFRYEGETRFRELERGVLERVIASGDAAVVSTAAACPSGATTWSA